MRKHLGGIIAILASALFIGFFVVPKFGEITDVVEKASAVELAAMLICHAVYVALNAEIWFTSVNEANSGVNRKDVYLSFLLSAWLWPVSAILGMAGQVWFLERINSRIPLGHVISSLAPVIWVKGMTATLIIFGFLFFSNMNLASSLVILTGMAAFGGLMILIESKTRKRDLFHGLAVIRKPKKMLLMSGLILLSWAAQAGKLYIALHAASVHIEIKPWLAAVLAQGFAGAIPMVAGPGSAALAFSSEALGAASAGVVASAASIVASIAISTAAYIYSKARKRC